MKSGTASSAAGASDCDGEISAGVVPTRTESTIRRFSVPLTFLIVIGLSVTFIYHSAGPIQLSALWNRSSPFVVPSSGAFAGDDLQGRMASILAVVLGCGAISGQWPKLAGDLR